MATTPVERVLARRAGAFLLVKLLFATVRTIEKNQLPACYPLPVVQTAIYTRDDGIADWRYCRTGEANCDFEVTGTHIGMIFNPSVYTIIGTRLADAQ